MKRIFRILPTSGFALWAEPSWFLFGSPRDIPRHRKLMAAFSNGRALNPF
ncbi:hypothetical protein KCP75_23935 [Salmonella enterica subsp. enterica]|nr:hypothetical protein KCP75_23935 [Salmonella enterica subsp. enterica]